LSQNVFPQLRMTDWDRSRKFYIDGLGFTIDWEHRFEPHLPVFAQLTRDGLSLFLSGHRDDCQVGGAAYFFVPDVDAWYQDFTVRGVRPEAPPQDTDYHVREMTVTDPDGNRLRFGTRRTAPE
jgi:catechol 2,3-dioxygenase-like lactoylglutathione lyase family enzyme